MEPAVTAAAGQAASDGGPWVLHARPVRAGTVRADGPRFGDDVWRLDDALVQHHAFGLCLDFTVVPARYRQALKQLCYVMLSGPLPPDERRPAVATVHATHGACKQFLVWLDGYRRDRGSEPGPRLDQLGTGDFEAFQLHLLATTTTASRRTSIRGAVRRFWRYRSVLPGDRLAMDPHDTDAWSEPNPAPLENRTARIPEDVLGTLIVWAMRFVDDFAADILAVRAHQQRLRRRQGSGGMGQATGVTARLYALLEHHQGERIPLPGYRGRANIGFMALQLGCNAKTLQRLKDDIDRVATVVGVSEHSYYDLQPAALLDGQPWLEAIASATSAQYGLPCLLRMVQASAYVLIAFFSGMRDAEIKHLRRGCLSVERDEQDRPYRWKVTGRAFKGEDDPHGVDAEWVVAAPAARAVQILHRLQPPDTPWLFACLPSPGAGPASRGGNDVLSGFATRHQLHELLTWIERYCADHARADAVPHVEGRRWPLAPTQFRRTLAWFIARRPGGVIAGAIAYRHLSIQMFEGYAGTSDSGFRAEVESEQALARGEHLLSMTDAHEHKNLHGPAAEEATARLGAFAATARFAGSVVTDPHRLRRVLQRADPGVYPGTYSTCVHDRAKALCRPRTDTTGRARPHLDGCQPLHCPNVALTAANTDALRAEADRLHTRLNARPPLPPLLAHQTRARLDEITAFLDRHTRQDTP